MTIQKMTEINKSNDRLDALVQLLNAKPELVDVLLDNLLAGGKKKKKLNWRGKKLTLFPNDEKRYLTPKELEAKQLVDTLVKAKKLSKTPSVAAMNSFFQNGKIRNLSKDIRFFAKHYYKQYILDWSVFKKK